MTIPEYVQKYDQENQFEVLNTTYKQIDAARAAEVEVGDLKKKKFSSIVITGLGGSAISGDILQIFLQKELTLPYIVNRSYHLPPFSNKNTLVIVSSYSGNTEETISVFNEAVKAKCGIICLGSGGKIMEAALKNNIPYVKLEKGFQPRYSLYNNFFALLKVFEKLGLIADQQDIVEKIRKNIYEQGIEYSEENNPAVTIAQNLIGFIPIIYSAVDITSAVGTRIKCQFNENSKLHAFHNIIPELNHNEIIGWETFLDKQINAKVINLIDKDYDLQIRKRFEITSELINGMGTEVINLSSNKDSLKERLFDLIYLGDWISYYLAILRGINPTSIKNINILKERLAV